MKKHTIILLFLFFLTIPIFSLNFLDTTSENSLSQIVEEELTREFETLRNLSPSVYYLAYRIDESKTWSIQGSFGNIIHSENAQSRYLTTMLRVGNNTFDNTHTFKGDGASLMFSASLLPIENVSNPIKQEIWKQTDKAYKQAKSDYLAKQNKIKQDELDIIPDFSVEDPKVYQEEPIQGNFNQESEKRWKNLIRTCSRLFLEDADVMVGDVSFEYTINRKYFLSSEGSKISQNLPYARFVISGTVKTDDGNQMPLYKSFYAPTPHELPSDSVLMEETHALVKLLKEIKLAAIAEPFTGPALLSPQAAGVFFHEIFGHRVEGHRLKDETDGQTFKTKVGERLLPKDINVLFDPTLEYLKETYLIGHYKFDDQGIASQKVEVIKDGVLENFLLSRIPVEGYEKSNGHGRASTGSSAVSRQSNMIISSSKPKTDEELRKMLKKECKKQGVAYGYYFKEVTGGFTQTGRYQPNAFNVMPTEVYRIYVDNRPDELVRGVDLIGTPLSMFSEITAAGADLAVFTGFCGAESGWVPVSAASPSVFVKKIETQRKYQTYSKGILLPPPSVKSN